MEWIDVKDRLPVESGSVIIFERCRNGDKYVGVANYDAKDKDFFIQIEGDYLYLFNVTYWMPLPEPPKE